MTTRYQMMTQLDQMTAASTNQQVFAALANYLVEFDPSLILALNTVASRITASAVAMTVPSNVLIQAQASGGRDAYPNPLTL